VRALGFLRFGLSCACLVGLALLVARQQREARGLDCHDPHVRRGGFGRRREPRLTWPVLALGLLALGVSGTLLAGHYAGWW
jgi:hypothetical protein